MKNIKKIAIFTILTAGILQQSLYANKLTHQETQEKIKTIVQKHHAQAKVLKHKIETKKISPKEEEKELKKILEEFKKDMEHILKHAPETIQYKELKKAIDGFNPKEITQNYTHIKTILKHVDKDIKEAILSLIPDQYKMFFLMV